MHLEDHRTRLKLGSPGRVEEPAQPTDLHTEVWLAVSSVMPRREGTKVKVPLAGTRHLSTRPFPVKLVGNNKSPQLPKSLLPCLGGKPPVFKGLEGILSDIVDFSTSLSPLRASSKLKLNGETEQLLHH